MADRRCDTCRFFGERHVTHACSGVDIKTGFCHRRAPMFDQRTGFGHFPELGLDDWCAEWKRARRATARDGDVKVS